MLKLKEILKKYSDDSHAFGAYTAKGVLVPKLFFPAGKITVIGARPTTGRTLFMLYLLKLIFEQKGGSHLFISNEEDEELLFSKLITTVTQKSICDSWEILKNNASDYPILQSDRCNIHHHFGPWEDLKRDIEEQLQKNKIDYLYIDKIQGLYSEQVFKNKAEELDHIMRELKLLSIKYKFAVIISTNLSKKVDKRRYDYRPQISDLPDGHALEEHSDLILFLLRLEIYNVLEDHNGNDMRGVLWVHIDKNRYGSLDSHILAFDLKAPCIKAFHNDGKDFIIG